MYIILKSFQKKYYTKRIKNNAGIINRIINFNHAIVMKISNSES